MGYNIHAFPPFNLIQKMLGVLEKDQAYHPTLAHSRVVSTDAKTADTNTSHFASGERVLQLDHSDKAHPLHRQLQVLAIYLSEKLSRHKAFTGELVKSSEHAKGNPPRNGMLPTFTTGTSSAFEELTGQNWKHMTFILI